LPVHVALLSEQLLVLQLQSEFLAWSIHRIYLL
jgi:hypothetical protein